VFEQLLKLRETFTYIYQFNINDITWDRDEEMNKNELWK
jgi:hypothetical protein